MEHILYEIDQVSVNLNTFLFRIIVNDFKALLLLKCSIIFLSCTDPVLTVSNIIFIQNIYQWLQGILVKPINLPHAFSLIATTCKL